MLKKLFVAIFIVTLMIPISALVSLAQEVRTSQAFYHTAGRLFAEGKLSEAKKYYRRYLSGFPQAMLVDNALFNLGSIAESEKDFSIAIRYFDLLLGRYDNSELAPQAQLEKAVCKHHLGYNTTAVGLAREFLSESVAPSLRARAYALLGDIYYSEGNLTKAVKSYLKAGLTATGEKVKHYNRVLNIIEKEKNRESLFALFKAGKEEFPHGNALYRLAMLSYEERNFAEFNKYGLLFLRQFPNHPKYSHVYDAITGYQNNPDNYKTKIGAILPLTGRAALQGEKILRGIQLAYSSFQGTEEVDLVVKDSAGSPEKALELMKELAQDLSVIAVIGPAFSKVAEEIAPISQKAGLPLFSPAASKVNISSTGPYFFRNCLTNQTQGVTIAEFAVNELNLKKFAIIHQEDKHGEEFAKYFSESVFAMGAEITTLEKYTDEQVDFTEMIKNIGGVSDKKLLRKLKRKNKELTKENFKPVSNLDYEAIFIPGVYEKMGLIIPQLEFLNIIDVILLGTNGWNFDGIVQLAKGHPRDFYFVDGFFTGAGSPDSKNFVEQYKSFFGEAPDILAAQSYDALRIILNSIQAGKINRESLKNSILETKNFKGASGVTTILPSGEPEKEVFILTLTQEGIMEATEDLGLEQELEQEQELKQEQELPSS